MASLLRQLARSFTNTFFYVWTVIRALLTIRSPRTVTVVPYTVDVNLERCTERMEEGRYTTPMPSTPPSLPPIPRSLSTAGWETIEAEDSRCQRNLRSSPAFSSSPLSRDIDCGTFSATWSASQLEDPNSSIQSHESPLPKTPSPGASEDWNFGPFSLAPPTSLFLFPPGDPELDLFKPTFCTSLPRTSKAGKGHKRATLTEMANITHINLPRCVAPWLPSPMTTELLVDTPLIQRPRRFSLGRKLAMEDLHSPSRVHSRWFTASDSSTSSQDPQFKTVSPLRIAKRFQVTLSRDPRTSTTSTKSEVSSAVISAIRDAFAQTRPECPEDEGENARGLISRESVLTCKEVPSASKRDTIMSVVLEGNEGEEGYSQDMPSGTPPPPYMDWNATLLGTFKPAALARISKELSYLKDRTNASANTELDDILASFEALISSMPKFTASLVNDGDSALFVQKIGGRSFQ